MTTESASPPLDNSDLDGALRDTAQGPQRLPPRVRNAIYWGVNFLVGCLIGFALIFTAHGLGLGPLGTTIVLLVYSSAEGSFSGLWDRYLGVRLPGRYHAICYAGFGAGVGLGHCLQGGGIWYLVLAMVASVGIAWAALDLFLKVASVVIAWGSESIMDDPGSTPEDIARVKKWVADSKVQRQRRIDRGYVPTRDDV